MSEGGWLSSCCNEAQHAFLFLYLLYYIAVWFLGDTLLAKPMRLLATAVHELSHAGACWCTGGRVMNLEVYSNEAGVTRYAGGWRSFIACAGYLGEAWWGGLFVVLSGGRRTSTAAAIGLILALLASLCYNPNRVLVGITLTYVLLTAGMIAVEWVYYSPSLPFLIMLYGVFLGTFAVSDIFQHLIVHSIPSSDAYSIYEESGRSICCLPRCVGCSWLLVAVFFQLFGIYLALILMSDECQDHGWIQCLLQSELELNFNQFSFDDWEWPNWGIG
jgi:hypothetical protein